MKKNIYFTTLLFILSCSQKEQKTIGSIERIDPSLDEIIDKDARIEILADGFDWTEGPVWVESQKMLLFSDIPKNKIYKWTEEKGIEDYLTPSGYTGDKPSLSQQPGSNGLLIDKKGNLILCQHGDRRVARMDASISEPKPVFISIADNYSGKKFNSPNDAVFRSNGDLFFTDPPYGLPNREKDSTRQMPYHGVYKVTTDGKVTLLIDSLTRPNGIGFTPDEKTLIVANSDPEKAVWYMFDLDAADALVNPRILQNATENLKTEKGNPDGLKVDKVGNIFATGPGGVWIFNSAGKLTGKIKLPERTANVALADEDKTLYLTSDMYLLRLKMR